MIWICSNGHEIVWIQKGEATKPTECPICKSKNIDVREV